MTQAPNNGISITDAAAVEAFFLSVIPKPTQSMPSVHHLVYATERAERRLSETGFPASEFEGATLQYRSAIWRGGRGGRARNANFKFRRDSDGWKLTDMSKCVTGSEIFDRHRISVANPELQAEVGKWNI